MKLLDVANDLNGSLYGNGEAYAAGVSIDTRKLEKGNLFFALQGERDGHQFLLQAAEKGAAGAVVSEYTPELSLPQIVVKDTLQAIQVLAAKHRLKFNVPVVAITGSNGKTTTKDMVAAVLSIKLQTLKNQGNFNNELGVPLTLLRLDAFHQAAVVEMAMRGRHQIAELARIAKPQIGIITNIGSTHIELLGSVENIAQAKGELLQELSDDGIAILNGDDDRCRALGDRFSGRVIYYGLAEKNHVRALNIKQQHWQTAFEVDGLLEEGNILCNLPLPGLHNVQNALAALIVGHYLGLEPELLRRGLENVSLSAMRLEISEGINQSIIINDAYNANPVSMTASLQILAEISSGRTIALLGDMFELGDYAENGHREVGAKVAELGVDYLITVGDLADYIGQEALVRGMDADRIVHCKDGQQVSQVLKNLINPQDTVLIKGSRGMQMEIIAKELVETEEHNEY